MSSDNKLTLKELYNECGFLFGSFNSFENIVNEKKIDMSLDAVEKLILDGINNNNFFTFFKIYLKRTSISETFTYFDNLFNKYDYRISDDQLTNLTKISAFEDFFESLSKMDDYAFKNNLFDQFHDLYLEKSYESESETTYSDSVKQYLKEIGKIPVLNIIEEMEAFIKYQKALEENDEDAIEETKDYIINHNLRLSVSIAKKYINRGVPLIDLIQEGNIGLMKAFDKFDYTKGFKFSTYATWWIRQAVTRSLYDDSRTIRIPVHVHESIKKIIRTECRLRDELKREPTIEELASKLNLEPSKVRELKKISQDVLSLDEPVNNEDKDSTMGDFIPDELIKSVEESAEAEFNKERVHQYVDELVLKPLKCKNDKMNLRKAMIIKKRYGLSGNAPQTLEETGKYFGVTRERIRQLEDKAIREISIRHRGENTVELPPVYDEDDINLKLKKFAEYSFYNDLYIKVIDYHKPSGKAQLMCGICGNIWTEHLKNLGKTTLCAKCALKKKKLKELGIENSKQLAENFKNKLNLLSAYIGVTPEQLQYVLYDFNTDDISFLTEKLSQPKTSDELQRYNALVDKIINTIKEQQKRVRKRKQDN